MISVRLENSCTGDTFDFEIAARMFQDHYRQLPDDQLQLLALRDDLLPKLRMRSRRSYTCEASRPRGVQSHRAGEQSHRKGSGLCGAGEGVAV